MRFPSDGELSSREHSRPVVANGVGRHVEPNVWVLTAV